MKVIDFTKPRRETKLRLALGDEYVPITDPYRVPDGDYYLVPSSWWYKGKDPKAIACANAFPGKVVLMDYGREMEQKRKNKGKIRADYIAVLEDSTPNKIPVFKFSQPEFDPSPQFKYEPVGNTVLVTTEGPKGRIVRSLIRALSGKHIIWKMRSKYAHLREYYAQELKGTSHKLICPAYKDYNHARPLVEVWAQVVKSHVNVRQPPLLLSFPCQEMVRFGVPTSIWNGRKFVSHPRIERTKKLFGGKPKDWCTQNLVRNLRENLGSH